VDLLAQDVGDPAGPVGPRPAADRVRHAVTLTRRIGRFGAAERAPSAQVKVLRRAPFGGDQLKPVPVALLRHPDESVVFAIRMSKIRRLGRHQGHRRQREQRAELAQHALTKVPAVTLGETGGDTVTMTLNWGYAAGVAQVAPVAAAETA
jgi:hypothetical protein